MSTSTKLNLQHDHIKQPVIAGVVVLTAICAGIVVFNRLAGAEAGNDAHEASEQAIASLSVKVDSSSSSSSDSSDAAHNQSNTSVIVNGKSVPVDESGSVHKTIVSDDGHSLVEVSIDNNTEVTAPHKTVGEPKYGFGPEDR